MRPLSMLVLLAAAACGRREAAAPAAGSPLLYVWAGPKDSAAMAGGKMPMSGGSDFIAVFDADAGSASYGTVLASTAAGVPGAMAHHTELVFPAGRPLFANDFATGQIFLIDFSAPLAPKVIRRIDSVPGFRHPHSFARLPNGNVIATLQFGTGRLAGDPGGIAEFTPNGDLVRTGSAADPAFAGARLRVYGLAVQPAVDRAFTTSSPMDDEKTANVVQVWRLSDLTLLKTLPVPGVPGDSLEFYPFEPRTLADGKTVFLNSYTCGFYLITGLDTPAPRIERVMAMRAPVRYGCAVPVIRGHYEVLPIAFSHVIAVLDIADPAHPKEIADVPLDPTFFPHWASADPRSDRIVVTEQGDGVAQMRIFHFDSTTGSLTVDERFRDPGSAAPGVAFANKRWPHGAVKNAYPHGALFAPGAK